MAACSRLHLQLSITLAPSIIAATGVSLYTLYILVKQIDGIVLQKSIAKTERVFLDPHYEMVAPKFKIKLLFLSFPLRLMGFLFFLF